MLFKKAPKEMKGKNEWKKFEYVVAPTDEQSWWVEIDEPKARKTSLIGMTLKENATIKEAIEELLTTFDKTAIVSRVMPYSKGHTCPVCQVLIDTKDSIYEICDDCKADYDTYRERGNMTEDEVVKENILKDFLENARKEAKASVVH